MSFINSNINSVRGNDTSSLSRVLANQGGVSVEGNRISWPDDGWYEVQSATSFNTMNEGGTSATMAHGTWHLQFNKSYDW